MLSFLLLGIALLSVSARADEPSNSNGEKCFFPNQPEFGQVGAFWSGCDARLESASLSIVITENGIDKVRSLAEFTTKVGGTICFSSKMANDDLRKEDHTVGQLRIQGYKIKVIDSSTIANVEKVSRRCANVRPVEGFSIWCGFGCQYHWDEHLKNVTLNLKDGQAVRRLAMYDVNGYFYVQAWVCDDYVDLLHTGSSMPSENRVKFQVSYLMEDGHVMVEPETDYVPMIGSNLASFLHNQTSVRIASASPFDLFGTPFHQKTLAYKDGYTFNIKDGNTVDEDNIEKRFHTLHPQSFNGEYVKESIIKRNVPQFSPSTYKDLIHYDRPYKFQDDDGNAFNEVVVDVRDGQPSTIRAFGFKVGVFRVSIESKMPFEKFYRNTGVISSFVCTPYPSKENAREIQCTITKVSSLGQGTLSLYGPGSCLPLATRSVSLFEGANVRLPVTAFFLGEKNTTATFFVCSDYGSCVSLSLSKPNYSGDHHLQDSKPNFKTPPLTVGSFFDGLLRAIRNPLDSVWNFLKLLAVILVCILALILFYVLVKMILAVSRCFNATPKK